MVLAFVFMKGIRHKEVSFVSDPYWNKGIEYVKDQERGYDYKEDLYVPGYFELPIKKGESIIFSAGVGEIKPRSLSMMYNKEMKLRTYRNSFFNCLKNFSIVIILIWAY